MTLLIIKTESFDDIYVVILIFPDTNFAKSRVDLFS